MNSWHDYPNLTDGALDAFIKRFPSDPDHAAATEFERRRTQRAQRNEKRSLQPETIQFDKGIFTWVRIAAIAGVAILALAVLCLAFPVLTSRTQRARRPARSSASFPEPTAPIPRSLPSAEGFSRGAHSSNPSTTNTPSPEPIP